MTAINGYLTMSGYFMNSSSRYLGSGQSSSATSFSSMSNLGSQFNAGVQGIGVALGNAGQTVGGIGHDVFDHWFWLMLDFTTP